MTTGNKINLFIFCKEVKTFFCAHSALDIVGLGFDGLSPFVAHPYFTSDCANITQAIFTSLIGSLTNPAQINVRLNFTTGAHGLATQVYIVLCNFAKCDYSIFLQALPSESFDIGIYPDVLPSPSLFPYYGVVPNPDNATCTLCIAQYNVFLQKCFKL